MSAWNGSLEVHQADAVDTIPDLREFDPNSCTLDTVDIDGEILVHMQSGDFFVYYPNAGEAMEIPIEPEESAIPGFIMYVPMGEDISGSTLQLNYTFHRELINEPLFRITIGISLLWVIALITFMIIELQLKKYNERHEHDNEMIKEAIETFTGFIDAKDPYTNGHSNRVYRKKLTKEAILKEIETHKGTQFDPEIADILLKLIKSGKIDMSE